jgi:ribosomal protein S18 acetylase RimI-like enzyme
MADVEELGPDATRDAYEALLPLRPRLGTAEEFVARVNDTLRADGYRLVVSREDGQVAAVAGFRIGHDTAVGRYLYVDDLSTHPDYRGRGHAGRLLDWLVEEGRRRACDALELDSGLRPERDDAYRLYLNKRLAIRAMHFARPLR